MNSPEPVFPTPRLPTRDFRKRLLIIAIALAGAQLSYCVYALYFMRTAPKPPMASDPSWPAVIGVCFPIALVFTLASFPLVRWLGTRQASSDAATASRHWLKEFFLGFVLCEFTSLIALVLFFMYGRIIPLIVLAAVAAVGILLHHNRINRLSKQFDASASPDGR